MKKSLNILIVEDEALTSLYLKMELTNWGHNILNVCASGEEALSIIKTNKPDLILMDINLAGKLDGIETANEVLKIKNIPIIFVTGYSEKKVVDNANLINPLAYFVKPIVIDELKKCKKLYKSAIK